MGGAPTPGGCGRCTWAEASRRTCATFWRPARSSSRRIFALLPCAHCPPGMTYFGFEQEAFLEQLCDTFDGAITAYQPDSEYYSQEDVDGFFGGVSVGLTREFPMSRIRVRRCGGASKSAHLRRP